MTTQIEEIQYWVEALLPASIYALNISEAYFDRQTEQRKEKLDKTMNNYIKSLDDWYLRIEHGKKFKEAGTALKAQLAGVNGILSQYLSEVNLQQQFMSSMASHEQVLNGLLSELGSETLTTMKKVETISTRLISIAIAAALLMGGVFAFFAIRGIVNQIKSVSEGLKDIAEGEGDLTRRLPVQSNDEVGQLAKWFNQFLEKLHLIKSTNWDRRPRRSVM